MGPENFSGNTETVAAGGIRPLLANAAAKEVLDQMERYYNALDRLEHTTGMLISRLEASVARGPEPSTADVAQAPEMSTVVGDTLSGYNHRLESVIRAIEDIDSRLEV